MSTESDFESDIPPEDFAQDLSLRFRYKKVLIQPSKQLGCGSYGTVVKAKLDGLPCAAKILHHTLFTSNDPGFTHFIGCFQQECQILRRLKHPCIVQFLGVLKDPRPHSNCRPILLMEEMEQSLTQFLGSQQRALPYHVQVDLTYNISLALDYLHHNGILHRDLSSNNILLRAGSQAKLTDFGMSKIVDLNQNANRNKHTKCPGTLVYMPPEALAEPPDYCNKIDVFSTGVLIVQIITCQYPNPTQQHKKVRDSGNLYRQISELERRKNDLSGVFTTHPLRQIAVRCLSDEKKGRPTATVLCQELVQLLSLPMYAESKSEYNQQILALPPTKSALAMRNAEIDALDKQIENLDQGKRTPWRKKQSVNDDCLRELHQNLKAEKKREEEEQREIQCKSSLIKRVKNLEAELSTLSEVNSENDKLRMYVEELEKEATELNYKISRMKHIIETHLESREDCVKEDLEMNERLEKRCASLPSLKLGYENGEEGLLVARHRIQSSKILRVNLSEIYQYLHAESILDEMVKRRLIQSYTDIISYQSNYAKNIAAGLAILSTARKHPLYLLSLCYILKSRGCPQQRYLALKLRSDHERVFMMEQLPLHKLESPAKSKLTVSDLQSQFQQALQSVMKAFRTADSLFSLKDFFSQLVLPMGEGRFISVVQPTIYENATTSKEIFKYQFILWNCFSPYLLKMVSEECPECHHLPAIEQFFQFRSQCATSQMFHQTMNNKSTHTHPFAPLKGSSTNLQPVHASVRYSETLGVIRVSVKIDRPQILLQDYDDITSAVCGYFSIPHIALVYEGYSKDSQMVYWTISASVFPYLSNVKRGLSCNRLMAEQGILEVTAGHLHDKCLNLKEVELHEAVLYGLKQKIKTLALQKVALNCMMNGWTPLMTASFEGNADIVQTLIEVKAQIDLQNEDGYTALHLAAEEGKIDAIELLTEAQANVNLQTENGQTPLYIASCKGHDEVAKVLLKKNADLLICTENGSTPLMAASHMGHADVVQTLIKAKAPVNEKQMWGWTPLHAASQKNNISVVKLLVEAHAEIDIKNKDGKTPIDIAESEGHIGIVEFLQKRCSQPEY